MQKRPSLSNMNQSPSARSWRILHLSDFHLSDPDGQTEILRKNHFEEYIRDLFQNIKERCEPLDAIMITGDLVDKGTVTHFEHAEAIVNTIVLESRLKKNAVIVCPGNHDILQSEEENGNIHEAR